MAVGAIAALVFMQRQGNKVAVVNPDGSISTKTPAQDAKDKVAMAAIAARTPGSYTFSDGTKKTCYEKVGNFHKICV